jgi:signal transduction histidine kinase
MMQEGHQELYDNIRATARDLRAALKEQAECIEALERRVAALEAASKPSIEVYDPVTHQLLGILGGVYVQPAMAAQEQPAS